ncbi:hypothetical protein [Streptomyces albogriseolus]|uniref:hypothetical protein n=1 Tax=Streptomyces albogriseolus TaxID=1887 RepID=UPI0034604793
MAAVGAYQVQCPECGIALPVGVALRSPTREGDHLIVNLEPELTDVMAHAWTHETEDDH